MAGPGTTQAAEADSETLAHSLGTCRPFLDEDRVSVSAFRELVDTAARFSAGTLAALEVRVGRTHAPVDLSVRLDRAEALTFLDRNKSLRTDPSKTVDAARQLVSRWVHGGPELVPVHSLWFEFDADRPAQPVVCARLTEAVDPDWLLDTLWPILAGTPKPPLAADRIRQAVGLIPTRCQLLYLFDLNARGRNSARLEVYSESLRDLITWIEGLEHPSTDLLRHYGAVLSDCDRFHASIETGRDGWARRLGLEGSFRRLPSQDRGWRRLFDRLDERDLLAPPWRGLDSSWPGSHRFAAAGPDPSQAVARVLSHVKLVGSDRQTTEAKAYLLVQCLSRNKSRRSTR